MSGINATGNKFVAKKVYEVGPCRDMSTAKLPGV
jgi:hypothetical protein